MIHKFAAATLFLGMMTGASWADQCQDDVSKIETALASEGIDADKRAQLEDMHSQAVQLCGAGNTEEGLAVTAEALALLEVQ
jgi:hypothetical protein